MKRLIKVEKIENVGKEKPNPTKSVMLGRDRRSKVMDYLNDHHLAKEEMMLERIHDHVIEIPPWEKKRSNTAKNRQHQTLAEQAMGLDYKLTAKWTAASLFISIRWASDWAVYYKLPSNQDPQSFIESTLSEQYFLFLNSFNPKDFPNLRYALVSGDVFDWRMYGNKGDRNRAVAIDKVTGRHVDPIKNLTWSWVDSTSHPIQKPKLGLDQEYSLSLTENLKQLLIACKTKKRRDW